MSTNPFPWTDVSIDLETLGTKYNAPILSVGAVAFNRDTGKVGPTFYQEIDPDSAIKHCKPSASTIAWWITQAKGAQRIFETGDAARERKMALPSAMLNFVTFVRSLGCPRPWGNGATFDITLIEHSIDVGSVGLEPPWSGAYWKIRDMRTLIDAAESLVDFNMDSVKREGTHHNALDDAMHQAKVMIAAWSAIRDATGGKKPADLVKKSASKVQNEPPKKPAVQDDDDEL
jgi:hypothetical protein